MKLPLLEKRVALQILYYLYKNKGEEVKLSDLTENLKGSTHTFYSAIDRLLESNLIEEEERDQKRVFTLTEKGERVSFHLSEIEEILGG